MKKFFICLAICFSFLFVGNVSAVNIVGKSGYTYSNLSSNRIVIYSLTDSFSTYSNIRYGVIPSNANYLYTSGNSVNATSQFGVSERLTFSRYRANSYSSWSSMSSATSLTSTYAFPPSSIDYSYYDIWNDNFSSILYCGDVVSQCISSYTVNFHLNGGAVWDMSNLLDPHLITEDYSIESTTDELSEYLTHLTPIKDYSNFIGWYYDSDFTLPYDSSNVLSSNIDLYAKFELYDYLQGYKRIDLTTDDRYYMLSDVSSGSVFIPKRAFDDYGGRLSYYDNDLSSQPYTSYIQDYVTTPDDKFVRQDFNLSNYAGADWVMFSKYIYLEGEDNISYSIFVPDSSYDSSVVITPNSSGGNQFDFEYKDSNGDIQEGQVNSADLSQTSPLLGNIFDDFSTNTFGLTSIITAPLSLIQSLSSTSCTPLSLPLPFIGGTLTLPCMYDFYSNTFGVLFTLYQTITFGVVAYWVLVRIFNMVKDFKNPDHDEIEVVDL